MSIFIVFQVAYYIFPSHMPVFPKAMAKNEICKIFTLSEGNELSLRSLVQIFIQNLHAQQRKRAFFALTYTDF